MLGTLLVTNLVPPPQAQLVGEFSAKLCWQPFPHKLRL